MEEEILLHDDVPVELEEQELAWKIYLAILESLIVLDLLDQEWECKRIKNHPNSLKLMSTIQYSELQLLISKNSLGTHSFAHRFIISQFIG